MVLQRIFELLDNIETLNQIPSGGANPRVPLVQGNNPSMEDDLVARAQLKDLSKMKGPLFYGTEQGIAAEAWLLNIEQCFILHRYLSNVKVRWTFLHLRGFGSLWWEQELEKLGIDVALVTWELFVERFKERFMSEYWCQARSKEFFHILQSGSTVEAYEHRFYELKKYSGWSKNDKVMIQHFIRGLVPKIREEVRTFRPVSMQEASEREKLIEMK